MKKTKKIINQKTEKKNVSKFSELMKNKKFKWILIASVALVLCVATVLSIVLINNSMSPLEKFMLKIARKQNFQMDVVLVITDFPILGPIAFAIEMDGNVTHIPDLVLIEECYVEQVGDETFKYTKGENGKWVKNKEDDSDDESTLDLLGKNDLEKLINPDNYELVEGTENLYRPKTDVQFEKIKDVTITLEDDSCKIEMITYIEEVTIYGFTLTDVALETQIVISKIGQVDITLPKVA